MLSPAAKIWIFDSRSLPEGAFRGLRILFMLNGEAEIVSGSGRTVLKEGGYLAVEDGTYFSVSMPEEGLLGLIEYAPEAVDGSVIPDGFRVSSSSGTDPETVRRRISALLERCFGCYDGRDGEEALLLEASALELLYVLKTQCLVPEKLSLSGSRRDEKSVTMQILGFLHQHYAEPVSLSDLARITWFSEAYLSRYIRKQFGETFTSLLMGIRLDHAVERVAGSSDKLILIALENGFSNTVAFNREFRKRYGMTPSEYRRTNRVRDGAAAKAESAGAGEDEPGLPAYVSAGEDPELNRKIRDYMSGHGRRLRNTDLNVQTLTAFEGSGRPLRRIWSRMINAGLARDLLRADVQEHLNELQKNIGFEYVRFWDIWSPELMLYDGSSEHTYSFGRLDAAIEYLWSKGIYPYIDLGFKPVQLMADVATTLLFEDRKTLFQTKNEFCDFVESFLRHYIRLYGEEYVEHWCLELWMDARIQDEDRYLDLFEEIYQRSKALLPRIRIGGAGFSREHGNRIESLLAAWGKRYSRPDFVSVYMYPFDNGFLDPLPEKAEQTGGAVIYRRDDYVPRFTERVRELMQQSGLGRSELHLSEWNSTFVNRDPLNDGLYKGAYIARSLIQMIGKVDVAGYWFASDLFSGYYDSDLLLDGSGGLLSKDGICKPAYYGLEFFNRLGHFRLASDENSIITSDGVGRYRIVCHHYVHPDDAYFEVYEKRILQQKGEWNGPYFHGTDRPLRYEIHGVPDGLYTVKTRILDSEHGSVEDEWNRMGRTDALDRRDVEYLRRISVPRISIETAEVTDHCLVLTITLPPNGIGHIHVFPAG